MPRRAGLPPAVVYKQIHGNPPAFQKRAKQRTPCLLYTSYTDVAGAQVETKIPIIKSDDDVFSGLFYKKIRSFLDAIKEGKPAPVPSSQILYNQAIIDGICKSAELGREIEIKIPEI